MMRGLFATVWILVVITFFNCANSVTVYRCSRDAACGCSVNPVVLSRIVGGEPAANLTWGWMVSLRSTTDNSHFCGGSIISPSYILTAAHCTAMLVSPLLLRVHAGSIYDRLPLQVRDVTKIINHPLYSATDYLNDIAILKLASPLNLTQIGIDKVCLPNVTSEQLNSQEYPAAKINVMQTSMMKTC
jgi:secreted trypsin-like serine protease